MQTRKWVIGYAKPNKILKWLMVIYNEYYNLVQQWENIVTISIAWTIVTIICNNSCKTVMSVFIMAPKLDSLMHCVELEQNILKWFIFKMFYYY